MSDEWTWEDRQDTLDYRQWKAEEDWRRANNDAPTQPPDYKLAQAAHCTSCRWKGKRRELIWSRPRGYICPECHETTIVMEDKPPTQPLWTKARVLEWLHERAPSDNPANAVVLASDIVYDYEAALADLRTTIATLQQQLAAAQGWVPVPNNTFVQGDVSPEGEGIVCRTFQDMTEFSTTEYDVDCDDNEFKLRQRTVFTPGEYWLCRCAPAAQGGAGEGNDE